MHYLDENPPFGQKRYSVWLFLGPNKNYSKYNLTDSIVYVNIIENQFLGYVAHENVHQQPGWRITMCHNTNPHAVSALKELGFLAAGNCSYYDSVISRIREDLSNGKLRLEDIGTSEKGIAELRTLNAMNVLRRWLHTVRKGDIDSEFHMINLRRELETSGLTPADIGTDENELEMCRVQSCKSQALWYLSKVRECRGGELRAVYVNRISEILIRGNLTPAEVGINMEELAFAA